MPFIPTCPPPDSFPILSAFFVRKGFPGDATQLDATVEWLEGLEVTQPDDFIGLGAVRGFPNAVNFSDQARLHCTSIGAVMHCPAFRVSEVLDFLQGLVQVK